MRVYNRYYDAENVISNIEANINYIYDILKSGKYIYQDVDENRRNIYDIILNSAPINYLENLTWNIDSTSTKRIGYNQISIYQSTQGTDVRKLLDYVSRNETELYFTILNYIKKQFYSDYNYLMGLSFLSEKNNIFYDSFYVNKYSSIFTYMPIYDLNLANTEYYSKYLRNSSYILYETLFNIIHKTLNSINIHDKLISINVNIFSQALQYYMPSNIDDFTNEYYDFVINNLMLFQFESGIFKESVKSEIKNSLNDIFNDIDLTISTDEFLQKFNVVYNDYIANDIVSYIYNKRNNDPSRQSLVNNSYIRTNSQIYNDLYFNDLDTYVYNMFDKDTNYINGNEIEYINYQFIDDPLFFINNHFYGCYYLSQKILDQQDIRPIKEILELAYLPYNYFNMIQFMPSIVDLIRDKYLENPPQLNNIIKLIISDLIYAKLKNYFNSPQFTNKIINTLLQNIISKINKDFYLYSDQKYQFIKSIKLFSTCIFAYHIYNNDIITPSQIQTISDNIKSKLLSLSLELNNDLINQMISNSKSYVDINSFYKKVTTTVVCSKVINYVDKLLSKFFIFA
jgi:hypothetical protein